MLPKESINPYIGEITFIEELEEPCILRFHSFLEEYEEACILRFHSFD